MIEVIYFLHGLEEMLKIYSGIILSFIVSLSFATPCTLYRSCFVLKNQHTQSAQVKCNGLNEVRAEGYSQGSSQLDLNYGDGLGAPEPRQLKCILKTGTALSHFNFYNPYWGSLIEFHLISVNQLAVRVKDGWSSEEKHYAFNW